jgi:hypothetical protein
LCCCSPLIEGFFFISLSFCFLQASSTSSSPTRTFCFSDHLTFLASSHLASTCRPPLNASSSQYFVNNVGGRKRKKNISCQLVLGMTRAVLSLPGAPPLVRW